MAEDMRVLDEMLADGGLKVGSEEVEAYKYSYRCNNFTNITTGITTSLLHVARQHLYQSKDVITFLPRNCRQWTSAINLYRGAFTAASRAFWADPGAEWCIT